MTPASFAIYLHSFVFLVLALVTLPDAVGLGGVTEWLWLFALLVAPLYLVLGMKRFYDERWLKTLAKFGFVSASYGFMGGMTMIALLLVAVLTV